MMSKILLGVFLATIPYSATAFLPTAPHLVRAGGASKCVSPLCDSNSFAGAKDFRGRASLSVRRANAVSDVAMSLSPGDRVAVLGAFERIGVCVAQGLVKSSYKPVVQVPKGFTSESKVKWPIDGLGSGLPAGLQLSEEMPVCPGAILASEEPAEAAEIAFVLGAMDGLKKCVFMSRAGVERRDSFLLKFNPFLKIDKWYEAEEAVKKAAAEKGFEYAIVRTGPLEGGPFYNSNREFASALEGSLFDLEMKAMSVSRADTLDAKTSRDLASQALIQALDRDVHTFSVTSAKEGPLSCSVENHMECPAAQSKPRKVYTPSREEWDAAFAQA